VNVECFRFCKTMTTETLHPAMMPAMKTEFSHLDTTGAAAQRAWNGGTFFGLRREAQRHAAFGSKDCARKAVSPLRSATAVHIIAALLLCVLALIPSALSAATNDLSAALQRGLFEEEGNRDLDAAISAYQSLAAQFDKSRQVAATAIFRLGECYRKLGRTNEAAAQYERIVREFSDQNTLVALSQQNLAGLRQSPAAGDVPIPVGPGDASEETTRLAAQLKGIEQLKDNLEEQARAVLAFFPDETLKKMLLQLPKLKEQEAIVRENPTLPNGKLYEKLAEKIGYTPAANGSSFHTAYSPDGLELERHGTNLITDAHGELTRQLFWIKERVDFTVGIQKARLQVLQAVAAKTPVPESGTAEKSAPTTDDVDQEIRRIQAMIQNSPDLINSPNGGHPLIHAAESGWLKVAAFLLDHGANVNIPQGNGQTALHQAVSVGNKAMVELLLSRGADVNAKDSVAVTPLHLAAEKGFHAVAAALLANKADVNARNRSGDTPLESAAQKQNVSLIKLLTANGAEANVENQSGIVPLSYAAASGNLEAVKALLEAKADPNGSKRNAPLLSAIIRGKNLDVTELLLESGADPNKAEQITPLNTVLGGAYNNNTTTPLAEATSMSQLPVVRLLLKFKADPNSVLFAALQMPEILEALLDAGGNVESRLAAGNNPLLSMASWGPAPNPAVVELLLKRSANPKATDDRGRTALHYLAEGSGNRKVFELLLANHADPNAQDKNGQTPLDLLKPKLNYSETSRSATELVNLLRQNGALDDLPKLDRIEVSQDPSGASQAIFSKGTNGWNHFTLFDALATIYGAAAKVGENSSPGQIVLGNGALALQAPSGSRADARNPWQFPDLAHVTIRRATPDGKGWKEIPVDMEAITKSGDCGRDVPLEWGDVLSVRERDHLVSDRSSALPQETRELLIRCLKRAVTVRVQGESKVVDFAPDFGERQATLSILAALDRSGLLRVSSDLTRVKIIRHDLKTNQKREWIADGRGSDLLLRDGDVIEVPEK
jgi:ankyrin repeat protein/tetratricopeptide (TPR) repeat protein